MILQILLDYYGDYSVFFFFFKTMKKQFLKTYFWFSNLAKMFRLIFKNLKTKNKIAKKKKELKLN